MRRGVLVLALALPLVVAACGSSDGQDTEGVAAPTEAAEVATSDGDLSDSQRTCLTAGEAIADAAVPAAAGGAPAPGADTIALNERIRGALEELDGLQAIGDLAAGINEVEATLARMTALGAATDSRSYTERRADLTAAVTELQGVCREAGVPDFLNP